MFPHYSAHPTYHHGTHPTGPSPPSNTSIHSMQYRQSPISVAASSYPAGTVHSTQTMPFHPVQSSYGNPGPFLLPLHASPALASLGIFCDAPASPQLSTMRRVTGDPIGDPILAKYAHSHICTPSPWRDPVLTHSSSSTFTLIIANHELPHWSLPGMAYLPADHHHQYGSDFSSGYISPDNTFPQDLSNHHLVPPSIIPLPHISILILNRGGSIIVQYRFPILHSLVQDHILHQSNFNHP